MNVVLQSLGFPAGTLLGETRPWFETLLGLKYQPSTVRLYHKSFTVFSRYAQSNLGRQTAQDVTREDFAAFKADLVRRKLAQATRENYVQTPKSYFDWLEKTGGIFDNPAHGLVVPRRTPRFQRIHSEEEIGLVIDSITGPEPFDDLDRALLEVIYGAGLRIHELAGLTIDSVDINGCTVRVLGKGAKERIVPITNLAARATRLYIRRGRKRLLNGRKGESALWIGRFGRPVNICGLRCRIVNRARRVNVRMAPHDLRRAYATHLLRRGVSPAILKELLGHATYAHLKEYLRYVQSDLMEIHRRAHPGR